MDSEQFTIKLVRSRVKEKKYHLHSVRLVDKPIYKSNVYNVFNLVYDRHHKVVKHFYCCRKCGHWIKVILSTQGNSLLRRHKCFKEYQKKLNSGKIASTSKNVKTSEEMDSKSEEDAIEMECESAEEEIPVEAAALTIGQLTLLSRVFAEFSEHCASPIKSSDIAKILPRSWKPSAW